MLGPLAHGLHLGFALLGLVGVGYLLLPQLRAANRPFPRTPHRPSSSTQEHERRVAALPEAVRSGALTTLAPTSPETPDPFPKAPLTALRDCSSWRGLAVGSSVAAASAHAAVFPHHLQEAWFVGLFFLAVALAQAAWGCLVTLDTSD